MAGVNEQLKIEEAHFLKSKVNLIIKEFSHIAYSGCKDSLDEQGIKPSILKSIFKTWHLKSRVFNEMSMFGETLRDTFKTFLRNPDVNISPPDVRDIVKSRAGYARRSGESYLYVLKVQLSVQRMYNACVRTCPVFLSFDQFLKAYLPDYVQE